ncbi:MAG: DegT/DnrJ/EryC1/StrS family aminotransferase [Deltaproteobacteria bacterium]|nr:DegT/DnrJ/EryC1/StrS family aminotransferase [Deltaproteobacteria bacterium]
MGKPGYIPVSSPALIGREKEYVLDCMESSWISSTGKYIGQFEKAFAQYLGAGHAIAVSNGTVALHLALLALGIGPGDEVIVPTLTYVATANAVKYTGAVPVLAESEPGTGNIGASGLEKLITSKTKAIIPVPLYGHPCDMASIMAVAKKHGLKVIEDAAEALGAKYNGKLCGGIADISTFSFYGNKTITTGEGGMVVTNDGALAEKVRLFKGQGMDPLRRYWFPVVGYNYRMTNVQAAIGLAQIERIGEHVGRRKEIALWYAKALSGIEGITLPVVKSYAEHSYWMYTVLVDKEYGMTRDELMARLAANGVETRPAFFPMHVMPVYCEDGSRFKVAEDFAARGMNLPTFYSLPQSDVERIAGLIREGGR